MVVAYTGSKSEPILIPSGATPSFAADVAEITGWLMKGRAFRRFSTQALMNSASSKEDNDLAVVDAIDGVVFKYDGTTGLWVMIGTPRFADASARNAAITAPLTGMRCRLATELFDRIYLTSAWRPEPARGLILPSSVVNGSVSAGGLVTSGAQSIVSVNDCFTDDWDSVLMTYDITTSAAAGVNIRNRVSGADAATAYDTQRLSAINATAAAVQSLNAAEANLTVIGVAGKHVGTLLLLSPKLAAATLGITDALVTPNPMTTSAGLSKTGIQHRTATAYTGLSFLVASGTLTINSLRFEGINKN